MRTHFYAAMCLGLCLAMLNGSAVPFRQINPSNIPFPCDDSIPESANDFTYSFSMEYLEGIPGSWVFPKLYSGSSWSVGDGVSGLMKDQIRAAWNDDDLLKLRKPVTPVICLDMSEHFFIAQYYECAPGQYGAMVLGPDGYFYNIYSFFAETLSSEEYLCYGLPVENTKKHVSIEGINYYSLLVMTDPCLGSKQLSIYFFPSAIPPSLNSQLNYYYPPDLWREGSIYSDN